LQEKQLTKRTIYTTHNGNNADA